MSYQAKLLISRTILQFSPRNTTLHPPAAIACRVRGRVLGPGHSNQPSAADQRRRPCVDCHAVRQGGPAHACGSSDDLGGFARERIPGGEAGRNIESAGTQSTRRELLQLVRIDRHTKVALIIRRSKTFADLRSTIANHVRSWEFEIRKSGSFLCLRQPTGQSITSAWFVTQ